MKRCIAILTVAILLLPSLALGRLGYTREQCDSHYGDPHKTAMKKIHPSDTSLYEVASYEYKDLLLQIMFVKDVAVRMQYESYVQGLSDASAKALLAENAAGWKWSRYRLHKYVPIWCADDGSTAYLLGADFLLIKSAAYLSLEKRLKVKYAPLLRNAKKR